MRVSAVKIKEQYEQQMIFKYLEKKTDRLENERYLTEQIITYLGNKRSLLDFIGLGIDEVKRKLKKEKLNCVDIFSGSGIVSRYLKKHSKSLYANDLEDYCFTINNCYLSNKDEIDFSKLEKYYESTVSWTEKNLKAGFITEMYSPKDDNNIKNGERVFYTSRNAMYLDTARKYLDNVPEPYKTFLLAPLIYEASVHNNTSGVFKGFYKNSKTGKGQFGGNGKNALTRILSNIELKMPIFSNFNCHTEVFQRDANELAEELPKVDVVYIDPPYNQHPYGSNYFMLNLLRNYKKPKEVSKVSGIPIGWNKSRYNRKQDSKEAMYDLCSKLKSKYLLISFSSDGFISKSEMLDILKNIGEVKVLDKDYNTFRGCRNLNGRDIHVKEFLYLVNKI